MLNLFRLSSDLMKQRLDENNQQLAKDLEVERSHHQRLVKEHGRLQQRWAFTFCVIFFFKMHS